ncbi:MAG TPA: SPOR domain-containing protein [Chitinophagales bacterium]|nr:SPOR domain-containing protein [Chitinophagales bacterium]HRK27233.1 SPOR domain-containing protein [Chitinophagales bacterium]
MKNNIKLLLMAVCILATASQYGCKGSKKAQAKNKKPATETGIMPKPEPAATATFMGYTREQIYFKVQVGAFATPLAESDPFFSRLAGEEVKIDISPAGLYRYSVGRFTQYTQAEQAVAELKKRGYEDIFIAAYGNDDRRIEAHMSGIYEFLYGKSPD